mgnify:FL=1
MNVGRKFQINFENNSRFKDSKFTKMVDSDLVKKQTEEFLAKGGKIEKLPDYADGRYEDELEKFDDYYQTRILGRGHKSE